MTSTKKVVKPKAEAVSESNGMPLFFRSPAVLDKTRHVNAGVKDKSDLSFAANANSLPLNTIEFLEASKYYPIVFTAEAEPTPTAIVGMEKDNYFIRDKQWMENTYIPAYLRQYPFIFFQPEQGDTMYLCVDEAAEAYTAKATKRDRKLFEDGEASALTKTALQFCTAFYQQLNITRNFCADLVKHQLLVPYHSKITTESGRQIALSGFTMIDEKAFNALPDEVILEFRRKGWLAFIYLALASATNWKRILELANQHQKS